MSYLFKVSTITERGEGLEVMKRNVTAENVGGEALTKILLTFYHAFILHFFSMKILSRFS